MVDLEQGENARERIRLANPAHLNFYEEHLDSFQILNYVPANKKNSEASRHFQKVRMLDGQRMMYLASLIAAGTSDGSINPRLDMKRRCFSDSFLPSACSILSP